MSTSLLQMVQDLGRRVKSLEAKVAELEKPQAVSAPAETKKLCPKCGKVPAYYFHVKNCREEQKNGVDGTGTSGTT